MSDEHTKLFSADDIADMIEEANEETRKHHIELICPYCRGDMVFYHRTPRALPTVGKAKPMWVHDHQTDELFSAFCMAGPLHGLKQEKETVHVEKT